MLVFLYSEHQQVVNAAHSHASPLTLHTEDPCWVKMGSCLHQKEVYCSLHIPRVTTSHPTHPPSLSATWKNLQSGDKETSQRFPNETQEHLAFLPNTHLSKMQLQHLTLASCATNLSMAKISNFQRLICLPYLAPRSCFFKNSAV